MKFEDLVGLGKIAAKIEQPIEKLIEVCSTALGKVYEPTHNKRMAKSDAERIKLISSAIEESCLPILYDNGKIIIDTTSEQEINMRMQLRLHHQELQKQCNIENIVENAYNDLKNEKTVSNESVDKDWITKFFNIAQDISREDMQFLWGRILSGEIKHPNSYSLRTLETLRNLSYEEAQIFNKLANYVIYNKRTYFIAYYYDIFIDEDIPYSDFMTLDDAGLLLNIETSFSQPLHNDVIPLRIAEHKLLFIEKNDTNLQEIILPCKVLTKAGIQLFSLVDTCFKESYFKKLSQKLHSENVKLYYADIIATNSEIFMTKPDKIRL